MSPKEIAKQNLANTIIKNMEKKNLEAYYCATSKEAVEKALSLMPEGASITWGGSESIKECGLMDAITIDGELVNIDGRANRVSLLCWGPQNVIVIAGMNKIASDVESAIQRVRDAAAPPNTVRLNKNTPCAQTGRCGNCYSPDCICSQILITRRSSTPNRIKVILVGEELGY